MKNAFAKDQRLKRVTKICKDLPEAIFELAGKHASYQVRKKTFAYYLNDHHGDGIVAVCCKVLPGDNEALIAAHPKKFYLPAYIPDLAVGSHASDWIFPEWTGTK